MDYQLCFGGGAWHAAARRSLDGLKEEREGVVTFNDVLCVCSAQAEVEQCSLARLHSAQFGYAVEGQLFLKSLFFKSSTY